MEDFKEFVRVVSPAITIFVGVITAYFKYAINRFEDKIKAYEDKLKEYELFINSINGSIEKISEKFLSYIKGLQADFSGRVKELAERFDLSLNREKEDLMLEIKVLKENISELYDKTNDNKNQIIKACGKINSIENVCKERHGSR